MDKEKESKFFKQMPLKTTAKDPSNYESREVEKHEQN